MTECEYLSRNKEWYDPNDYGGAAFPWHRQLSNEERDALVAKVTKSDMTLEHATRAIWHHLASGHIVMNANDEGFSLLTAANVLDFTITNTAYLCWDWFEFVYEFNFADVDRCFDDLWYPVADDLLIVNATVTMALGVMHEGDILICSLKEPLPPDPTWNAPKKGGSV